MREYRIPPEAAGQPLLAYLATVGCTMAAPCGGNGTCGKCRVFVREGKFLSRNASETLLLPDEEGAILACRAICPPEGGRIALREETGGGLTAFTGAAALNGNKAVSSARGSWEEGTDGQFSEERSMAGENDRTVRRLGMALDVGTTTLAAALCDLECAQVLATASCLNPQKPFGADVINRISAAEKGHLSDMQRLLLDSVRGLLQDLLSSAGICPESGEHSGSPASGGSSLGEPAPGESALGASALGESVLEEPVLGESALEEPAPGESALEAPAHAESAPGGCGFYEPAMDGSARGNLACTESLENAPPEKPLLAHLTVAGNPTMLHIFCGISPAGMGQYPFTPAFLEEKVLSGRSLSLPAEQVVVLPSASAFLGSDVLGGAVALCLTESPEPVLLMDIGTNGELLLFTGSLRGGRILGASAAAGPALEGAGISCGMGGVRGAVSSVKWAPGKTFAFRTVEDAPPVGICGSGLIDLVARLLESGELEETGYLSKESFFLRGIHKKNEEKFTLSQQDTPVRLTAEDVRELQLAKSALRAGVEALLAEAGLAAEDLAAVYLAGGLGHYLNPQSAARIGLFPGSVLPVVKAVGNTALSAALSALTSSAFRKKLSLFAAACETIALNESPVFNEAFMEHMLFPES